MTGADELRKRREQEAVRIRTASTGNAVSNVRTPKAVKGRWPLSKSGNVSAVTNAPSCAMTTPSNSISWMSKVP